MLQQGSAKVIDLATYRQHRKAAAPDVNALDRFMAMVPELAEYIFEVSDSGIKKAWRWAQNPHTLCSVIAAG